MAGDQGTLGGLLRPTLPLLRSPTMVLLAAPLILGLELKKGDSFQ
jgi:hypothetical protein